MNVRRKRASAVLALLLGVASGCGTSDPALATGAALTVTTSGHVRDSSGTPIAGALLELLQAGVSMGSATTDEDGQFSLAVEDGTYDIVITPPPESAFVAQTLAGQVIAADTTLQIVLVAASLVHYTVQLRDRDGAGVADAWVCATGSITGTCEGTDASGDARLEVLPGTYDLGVHTAWASPLMPHLLLGRSERRLTGDAIETITIDNRTLSGAVVDPEGNPVPNAWINASGRVTAPGVESNFGNYAQTDDSGRFEIGVLRGAVELYVAPSDGSDLAGRALETLVDEDDDIVITLPRSVLWTARVEDRDATALVHVAVCLRQSASSFCGDTDEDGEVRIAVAPGSYSLVVESRFHWMSPQMPETWSVTLPGPTLTADVTETVVIENRVLTGVVVDAEGNRVPNASLSVREDPNASDPSRSFTTWATADEEGRFTLPVLRGSVSLVVDPPEGSELPAFGSSTMVEEDSDIVLAVPRTVAWTGHLQDRDGTPLVGLQVCLGASWSTCGWTDTAGEVRLQVVPGTYHVSIQSIDDVANPQLPEVMGTSMPGPTLTSDAADTIVVDNRMLAGIMLDADGNPVANASLSAFGQSTLSDGLAWFRDQTQTDATGRFTLRGIDATVEMHVAPDPSSGLVGLSLAGVAMGVDSFVAVLVQFLTDGVEASVAAGETLTTDHEGDGATPRDPMETAVTSPVAGTVTIRESPITLAAPSGYTFLTQQVDITAPTSTPDEPLVISLTIDGSRIPLGQDEASIAVFRNGTLVPRCTGPDGVASPDPCVASRARVDDDVVLTVLTSSASTWNIGVRRIGDADGDGLLDDVDACPADAEDLDGFLDDDGCPDLDDDDDGVPDTVDLCPREAEDVDGFEDDDGCPEAGPEPEETCPDLDGDGRFTVRDQLVIARAMGSSFGQRRYREIADLDVDGDVDVHDLRLLLSRCRGACGR